jgi:hypothetical protein
MTSGNGKGSAPQGGGDSGELVRLRRELEEVRTRLDEETAYYRAELEAGRRRLERESTRVQADEVARRRRAEEQLHAAQAELARVLHRNDQLTSQLAELEATQSRREQRAVDEVRAAAQTAWREAEQELARQERELDVVHRSLAEEQAARQNLEASAALSRGEAERAQQAEQAATKLVVSLKKALWATAQARRQAEMELASLRGEEVVSPAAAGQPAAAGRDGGVHEVSQDMLKSVLLSDLSEDLAEEFLLMAGDASLDPAAAAPPPAAPAAGGPGVVEAPASVRQLERPSAKPAAPASKPVAANLVPLFEAAPVPDFRRGGLCRLLRNLSIAALAAGAAGWLLITGQLGHGLAAALELLP